jgi:hypothetical protein
VSESQANVTAESNGTGRWPPSFPRRGEIAGRRRGSDYEALGSEPPAAIVTGAGCYQNALPHRPELARAHWQLRLIITRARWPPSPAAARSNLPPPPPQTPRTAAANISNASNGVAA